MRHCRVGGEGLVDVGRLGRRCRVDLDANAPEESAPLLDKLDAVIKRIFETSQFDKNRKAPLAKCNLFPGKQVKNTGWCKVWVKAPGT